MANNKHNQLKRQYSLDGGITWKDLSPMVYKVGNIIETNSDCTDKDGCRWRILPITTDFDCDSNYNLYQVEIEECLNDDGVFVPSGERRRYQLIETYSLSCGYSGPICTPSTRYEYSYEIIYNGGAVEYNEVATPVVYQITTTIETDKGCNEIASSIRKQIYDYGITYSPSGDNISEEDRTVTATVSYSGSVVGSFDYVQKCKTFEEVEPTTIGNMVFKCDTNNNTTSMYYQYECGGVTKPRVYFTVTNASDGGYLYTANYDYNDDECDEINKIYINTDIKNIAYEIVSFPDTSKVTSFYYLFDGFDNVNMKSMNLSFLNTSNVISMVETFRFCDNLEYLNLSGWDLSKVTDISSMFEYCRKLIYLDLSRWEISDNIVDYKDVFKECESLQTINMTGSSCKSVNRIKALLNLNGLNNVKIITDNNCDINNECSDNSECGYLLSLVPSNSSNKVTSFSLNGTRYAEAFPDYNEIDTYNTVLSVDISTLSGTLPLTSTTAFLNSVTNSAPSVSSVVCFPDVSNVTDMGGMFRNYDGSYLGEANTALRCINAKGWNTSKVTNMNYMFGIQPKLTDIIGIEDWDVSNVTDMGGMFYGCRSLTTLDLSKWDMSNVIYQDGYGTLSDMGDDGMFENCESLVSLQLPNNINNITRFSYMFNHCRSLTTLNVRNIDTSKGVHFYGVFEHCHNLTQIIGVENWNMSNAKNLWAMFANCRSLTTLDLSNWDVSNVITDYTIIQINKGFNSMFSNCTSLTTLDLSGWKMNNNATVDYMFEGCNSLTTIYAYGCDASTISKLNSVKPTNCTLVY